MEYEGIKRHNSGNKYSYFKRNLNTLCVYFSMKNSFRGEKPSSGMIIF